MPQHASEHTCCCCRGFPVAHYKGDRLGLVLAYWGLALVMGSPLVSQTDRDSQGNLFGGLLNHITVGRYTHGEGRLHRALQTVRC